jgi:16S rRNA (cytosine1402-N4)-methyltransferase
VLNRKAIRPDARELADNPRSRSARLRVAERLGA